MISKRRADASRELAAVDEDRRAFGFGMQIANEAVIRALLLEPVAASAAAGHRDGEIARIRGTVEASVAVMLEAVGTPGGLEAAGAADVIDGVFEDLLADRGTAE